MLTSPDRRRATERRGPSRLVLKKKSSRRHGDRRDSPRIPRVVLVRELGSDVEFERSTGNIGLGGVMWRSDRFPQSRRVEVRFRLPDYARAVKAVAEVVRVELLEDELELQAVFRELDVKAELALARFVDGRARLRVELET